MDVRKRLGHINRLVADVSQQNITIGALLVDYLVTEQIERIQSEKLDEFLQLLIFSIRSRFAAMKGGMSLYWALSAHYDLEEEHSYVLLQKGLKRLRRDVLKQLACIAAREVLEVSDLPTDLHDVTAEGVMASSQDSVFTAEELAQIPITEEPVTLTVLCRSLNLAVGAERGKPGHIKLSILRHWLIYNGYLHLVTEVDGKKRNRPTDKGRDIGINMVLRDGPDGPYMATVFSREAQEVIRDNLSNIVAINKKFKEAACKESPNFGAPWTPDSDEQLKRLFSEGMSLDDIAREMGRSSDGVQSRLLKLELIPSVD